VFQLYSQVKGDTVLPTTTDSGTYSVQGAYRLLDTVSDVPYVDVVAARSADGKTVTLLCVNRHLELDIPTHFDLGSLHALAPANMKQIYSASRYELNDEIEPKHVIPLDGTTKVPDNGSVSVVLPHESVTVIRVPVN
jgi:alpha-N-arabinofuranosidase